MFGLPAAHLSLPGGVRYKLSAQRNRIVAYSLTAILGLLGSLAHVFPVTMTQIVAIFIVSNSSALLTYWLILQDHRRGWGINFAPAWLLMDLSLVTWSVGVSGGISSPVFLWYLTNSSAAAFVVGRRGVVIISALSFAAYLGLLYGMGQVRLFDHAFFDALSRMLFLYGGAALFLYGISEMRTSRLEIRRLHENDARKMAELTRLTGSLEQRSRELEDANLRIVEANRLKSQFLANMSHELRTPLNSIIGFSEILMNRSLVELPPKQQRFLGNIHSSGQHLLNIINDILDISKIEAGKMELQPELFPLRSVVDGVCGVMRGASAKRDIHFVISLPPELPQLQADPVKIKQVLYNLLSNAVKFSHEHGIVEISARALTAGASPLGADSLELRVGDHGIGIDPRDQDSIFQEFRQADGSATRRYEGTGLGLALVKKYVELHGGRVSVASTPGLGSIFTVLLPRQFSGVADGASPFAHLTPGARGPGCILVVEDDPTAYESLRAPLAAAGYQTVRARNGEEACQLALRLQPAAITLDLVLPGVDGWEVLKQLKADPATRAIPIIIISMIDNHELGLVLGAEDYFVKPVERDQLIHRLNQLVPLARSGDSPLLVIDDDPEIHAMLDELLAPLGYPLVHAYGGAEGLAEARARRPALIILDLMMPRMNGFEVAAKLREDRAFNAIPILALTAKNLDMEDRRQLTGKIAAVVRKGELTGGLLLNSVSRLLGRSDAGGSP